MKKFFKIFFVSLLLLLVFLMVLLAAASSAIYRYFAAGLPDVENLRNYQPSQTTTIYASNGDIIGSLFKENRIWTPIENIPPVMKQAIIAIEDRRFYLHHGIDLVGIARAARANLQGGDIQGASTITQQLARGIFLTPQRSLERKIKEAILALEIERKFTKEEILEFYLNQVYFGSGFYGVEAASRGYYGKSVKDIDLAQAALLAGLVAAPSVYSPLNDLSLAKKRQLQVLNWMLELGDITSEQLQAAYKEDLKFAKSKEEFQSLQYPYFTTYILHELRAKYNEDLLYRGGLRVYTTMDPALQNTAQKALDKEITRGINEGVNCHQGALVSIEPATGFIRAMVGGTKFDVKDQFNRAWQAQRQPGSSFKVFVYTTALLKGYSPDSPVVDSPISFPQADGSIWAPKNSDGKFWGAMNFRRALQFSRNVCAVKVMQEIGPDDVISTAYRMGIKEHLEPNLSLALGSGVVTPLEMCGAFAIFANGGIKAPVTGIKLIQDSEGRIIEDHRIPIKEEAVPADVNAEMVSMLQGVVSGGTGTAAQLSGREVAGKTGTSDEHRDTWFIGFTPQLATCVWIGNDDFSRMVYAFGGYLPAATFKEFMTFALTGKPAVAFAKSDSNLVRVRICADSGFLATSQCPHVIIKLLPKDEVPTASCALHPEKTGGEGGTEASPTPESTESAAATPTPTPTSNVEVINLDEGKTPAPVAPTAAPAPAPTAAPAPAPAPTTPAPKIPEENLDEKTH